MKLRGQLLLATLVVAALPLAGWRFIGQVGELLSRNQEQVLVDQAHRLASDLQAGAPEAATRDSASAIYIHDAGQAPLLDGYDDDWRGWLDLHDRFGPDRREQLPPVAAVTPDLPLDLSLAKRDGVLYLYLRMRDPHTRLTRPGERGDHVEFTFSGHGQVSRLLLAPTAPGRFAARGRPGGWPAVQGVWQVLADGWSLEMRIGSESGAGPSPGALGLVVNDVDFSGRLVARLGLEKPVELVGIDRGLSRRLAERTPPGVSAWVIDRDGFVRARTLAPGQTAANASLLAGGWQPVLFERLFGQRASNRPAPTIDTSRLQGPELDAARSANGPDASPRAATAWIASPAGLDMDAAGAERRLRVRAALPLDSAPGDLLVLERDADALMVLTSQAVLRLVGWSLLTFMAVALVLLGFALVLSQRIRRLQRAAEAAIGPDGRVVALTVRPGRGFDEISALSRSVASLLARLSDHQQYLRGLADRLAHELRTPLATIRSSLDNLEQQIDSGSPPDLQKARVYLDRAGQGSLRLNRIFQAMNQASRLEEALIEEPFQRFDLNALLAEYVDSLQGIHGHARFVLKPACGPVFVSGSPDLVAQLLDKLVDNALGFSSNATAIIVRLSSSRDRAVLEVENKGPAIDPSASELLFDAMVSNRRGRDETPHLGLGLYIARLIVQRHNGRISADATADGTCFQVEIPVPNI